MTNEQREGLRKEAIRWINSPEFDPYFNAFEVHQERSVTLRARLGSFRGLRPWNAVRTIMEMGIATPQLRQRYLQLAESGKIVRGFVCPALGDCCTIAVKQEGYEQSYIVAGLAGTQVELELVEASTRIHAIPDLTTARLFAAFKKAGKLLYGAQKSPFEFACLDTVYLFNAILPKSAVAPIDEKYEYKRYEFAVCVVDPDAWPAILPIPWAIAQPFLNPDYSVGPIAKDLPAWLDSAWFNGSYDAENVFMLKRIQMDYPEFYTRMSLTELMEVIFSTTQTVKSIELEAILYTRAGNIEKLREYLARGVSPAMDGLMYNAIATGNVPMVELLLSSGIDPNIRVKWQAGSGRDYSLHLAVLRDKTEIVKLLLARGANPNHKNSHGETALYYARDQLPVNLQIVAMLEPITTPDKINYRVDDFLSMENTTKAYWALVGAIRAELDKKSYDERRALTNAEWRILSLPEFTDHGWPNGITTMFDHSSWAIVPSAELMEAIDEPVFARMLRLCISIIHEYAQKTERDPLNRYIGFVVLDEETEEKLNKSDTDFSDHDYERDELYRKTMEYVRRNRELFI